MNKLKKILAATFTTLGLAMASIVSMSADASSFKDEETSHQRYATPLDFTEAKGVEGYTNGSFGIYDGILQSDAFQMVSLVLDTNTDAIESKMKEQPEGEIITRGEAAILIQNIYGLNADNQDMPFDDVSNKYKEAVAALYEHGITNGLEENQYGTDEVMKRGDFTVFLHRLAMIDLEIALHSDSISITDAIVVDTIAVDNGTNVGFIQLVDQQKTSNQLSCIAPKVEEKAIDFNQPSLNTDIKTKESIYGKEQNPAKLTEHTHKKEANTTEEIITDNAEITSPEENGTADSKEEVIDFKGKNTEEPTKPTGDEETSETNTSEDSIDGSSISDDEKPNTSIVNVDNTIINSIVSNTFINNIVNNTIINNTFVNIFNTINNITNNNTIVKENTVINDNKVVIVESQQNPNVTEKEESTEPNNDSDNTNDNNVIDVDENIVEDKKDDEQSVVTSGQPTELEKGSDNIENNIIDVDENVVEDKKDDEQTVIETEQPTDTTKGFDDIKDNNIIDVDENVVIAPEQNNKNKNHENNSHGHVDGKGHEKHSDNKNNNASSNSDENGKIDSNEKEKQTVVTKPESGNKNGKQDNNHDHKDGKGHGKDSDDIVNNASSNSDGKGKVDKNQQTVATKHQNGKKENKNQDHTDGNGNGNHSHNKNNDVAS